ncbi:CHAT domain-containing tetratricopeptide repeat protein [Oryzicola mucosus]|uniref:CHAT domain-containing protein n=1 Tax=Oryzicola mucosus TaxID=2767425 RepID=A0A8J6PKM9_9HYPH|nr:CHAT domain-containing protein [Oryzicola mucosus]MBD0416644.1 CHAT domain-containing protein [Oryzicola mucosus]
MRAFILAAIGAAFLVGSAIAQTPKLAEPDAEMQAEAKAGDSYKQWELGNFYANRGADGDLDRAIDLYSKSAEGYQKDEGETSTNAALVFHTLSATQIKRGALYPAITSGLERAIILAQAAPGSADLASALVDLGRAYQLVDNHATAIGQFDRAIRIYEELDESSLSSLASATVDRGISLVEMSRRDEAIAAYRQAAEHYRGLSTPEDANLAITLGNLASTLFDQKRWSEAETVRREQVAILHSTKPDSLELGQGLESLVQILQSQNQHSQALVAAEEAMAVYAKAKGENSLEYTGMMFGKAYSLEALAHYEQTLALLEDVAARYEAFTDAGPQSAQLAITLVAVARVNTFLAHYGDAEAAAKRAIAIFRKTKPGSNDLGYALQELGAAYQKLSKYRETLPIYEEARRLFIADSGDISEFVGDSYLNQGISLEGLKDYPAALKSYDKAIERYSAASGKDSLLVGYAINNTAWVYRRMERYAESDAAFRKALPIIQSKLGPTHFNTTKVLINIGITSQLLGRNDEAIQWSMKALSNINRSVSSTLDDQRWVYDTMAKAFKGRGDPKRAILFAKLAINAQQKIRSNNKQYQSDDLKEFKAEWRFLYQDLADLLIGEGRLAEAQAVLNMEKDEELSEFVQRDAQADLRDREASLTTREDSELRDMRSLLGQPIAAASAVAELIAKKNAGTISKDEEVQLASLESLLDQAYESFMTDVEAFLRKAGEEDAGVQKEIDAINLDYTADAQEELRAFEGKAAMLQVASLGEATHLFLTVPDASIHRRVNISRAELSRKVFEALDAIERRDAGVNLKMQSLYDILISPVSGDLKASGARTLMLNLQGFLRYVPFAALHDGQKYLIEEYSLALYTPAARTEFATADRSPEKSAGFGVTAGHPGFSPLPGVARELQAIFGNPDKPGALAGAASLDQAFTRESFSAALKNRPSIVHIASHFKLVPGRETDSFLLLGDGSPLSLSDIRKGRGFRFGGVDLLTLSACETARGGGSEGDEVESFGALAQMNGASSVMATLWPVADGATAGIMQSFYRHMVEGKMSKAEALRAAQIEAILGPGASGAERGALSLVATVAPAAARPASHPYFWSPFVLMGNWL